MQSLISPKLALYFFGDISFLSSMRQKYKAILKPSFA